MAQHCWNPSCRKKHREPGNYCSLDCATEDLEKQMAPVQAQHTHCVQCNDEVTLEMVDDEGICASCILERMEFERQLTA